MAVSSWNYATGTGRARKYWTEELGVEGFVRCFDLTVGLTNGWHPHIHAVVIVDADRVREIGEERFLAKFKGWFYDRWDRKVSRELGRPECRCMDALCGWEGRKRKTCRDCGAPTRLIHSVSRKHGVQVEWCKSATAAAEYLEKVVLKPAHELTSGHRKLGKDNLETAGHKVAFVEGAKAQRRARRNVRANHRTPFQLLRDLHATWMALGTEDADEDDQLTYDEDLKLWHEYEQGMQGRSALRTSHGFWTHPDWGVSDMTMAEQIEYLAESVHPDERKEIDEPEPVLSVIPWLYTWFVRVRIDGWVLRVCEEQGGGYDELRKYCKGLDGHWRPPNQFGPVHLAALVSAVERARRIDRGTT
jgi:hypothetical protein